MARANFRQKSYRDWDGPLSTILSILCVKSVLSDHQGIKDIINCLIDMKVTAPHQSSSRKTTPLPYLLISPKYIFLTNSGEDWSQAVWCSQFIKSDAVPSDIIKEVSRTSLISMNKKELQEINYPQNIIWKIGRGGILQHRRYPLQEQCSFFHRFILSISPGPQIPGDLIELFRNRVRSPEINAYLQGEFSAQLRNRLQDELSEMEKILPELHEDSDWTRRDTRLAHLRKLPTLKNLMKKTAPLQITLPPAVVKAVQNGARIGERRILPPKNATGCPTVQVVVHGKRSDFYRCPATPHRPVGSTGHPDNNPRVHVLAVDINRLSVHTLAFAAIDKKGNILHSRHPFKNWLIKVLENKRLDGEFSLEQCLADNYPFWRFGERIKAILERIAILKSKRDLLHNQHGRNFSGLIEKNKKMIHKLEDSLLPTEEDKELIQKLRRQIRLFEKNKETFLRLSREIRLNYHCKHKITKKSIEIAAQTMFEKIQILQPKMFVLDNLSGMTPYGKKGNLAKAVTDMPKKVKEIMTFLRFKLASYNAIPGNNIQTKIVFGNSRTSLPCSECGHNTVASSGNYDLRRCLHCSSTFCRHVNAAVNLAKSRLASP